MAKHGVDKKTQQELLAVWKVAKDASVEARNALESAEQALKAARVHFNKCVDAERAAWLPVAHSEWVIHTDNNGEFRYTQRSRIAFLDLG